MRNGLGTNTAWWGRESRKFHPKRYFNKWNFQGTLYLWVVQRENSAVVLRVVTTDGKGKTIGQSCLSRLEEDWLWWYYSLEETALLCSSLWRSFQDLHWNFEQKLAIRSGASDTGSSERMQKHGRNKKRKKHYRIRNKSFEFIVEIRGRVAITAELARSEFEQKAAAVTLNA